jgi:hypothetical protein
VSFKSARLGGCILGAVPVSAALAKPAVSPFLFTG